MSVFCAPPSCGDYAASQGISAIAAQEAPWGLENLILPEVPSLEMLWAFFRLMNEIRFFEERAAQTYTTGKIGGFCHLCIGQEALSVAAAFSLKTGDSFVTAYRAHGHAIARSLSMRAVLAELMGKVEGCSGGKGGSMHMFHKEQGFYGGHGIVGAQIPIGTGLAFSHKYQEDGGVCVTLLGDGATNQGQFFEAMNMAALWHLPVLYVIENNGYAMGTSTKRGCAGGPLYKRAEPFGIRGGIIEGHDSIEVYRVLKAMADEVRATSRPLILEVDTYRFKGHSMSDPGKYRSREELDEARVQRDPIAHLRHKLMHDFSVEERHIQEIEKAVEASVSEVFASVETMKSPPASKLFEDILLRG